MNPLIQTQPPDTRALLQAFRNEIFASLNCHQVGSIVSFNAAKQTAQIQIAIRRVVYNKQQAANPDRDPPRRVQQAAGRLGGPLQTEPTFIDYPVLVDCPVFILSGGAGVITFPIRTGDTCLVLFNDRDLDNWFEAGGTAIPNSPRLHDLSDGLALIGFRNRTNPVASMNETDIEMRCEGGKFQVAAKIGISNASTSLLTCLDNLITALTGWVDTGGQTPNPATVTALNLVKTQIDSLLK